jgi:hypothetical protein
VGGAIDRELVGVVASRNVRMRAEPPLEVVLPDLAKEGIARIGYYTARVARELRR